MKITNIKTSEDKYNVYFVTFEPNWLERLFGVKPREERFKDTGSTYTFGGGHVYYDIEGYQLDNGSYIGKTIDAFRRKW